MIFIDIVAHIQLKNMLIENYWLLWILCQKMLQNLVLKLKEEAVKENIF